MYIKLASGIASLTALLHLIGGQVSLVNPLLDSVLSDQVVTEWLGAWHLITVILFLMAYYFIRFGTSKEEVHMYMIKNIGWVNLFFGLVFVCVSIYRGIFAPQFVLFLLIAALIHLEFKNRP